MNVNDKVNAMWKAPEAIIITHTGKKVDLLKFEDAEVNIKDVAFALSNVARFAGHVPFFSVAQHCIAVEQVLDDMGASAQTRLYGLLHDASEAYYGDMPSPLKKHLHQYAELEDIAKNICIARLWPAEVSMEGVDYDLVSKVDDAFKYADRYLARLQAWLDPQYSYDTPGRYQGKYLVLCDKLSNPR